MKHTYHKLNLNCLVVLGGNGTHKTANLLREEGLNVITLPKTIDNDLWGTDMTFGFQSAVDIATEAIDRIHTTATSHSRVFIVEVMGHKVGWVTLHAGIAGGADIILLPEIPYDVDNVVRAIKSRTEAGKHFTIIAVAEGAITKEDASPSEEKIKKNRKRRAIRLWHMSLQRRSRTVWIRRFVSQCRDIRREVEARVRMTVCLQPDLEQQLILEADLILKRGLRIYGRNQERQHPQGSAWRGCRKAEDGRSESGYHQRSQDCRNQFW